MFKAVGRFFKSPKKFVERKLRKRAIVALVAAVASILVLYGYELPADIQNNIADIIDSFVNLFVQ